MKLFDLVEEYTNAKIKETGIGIEEMIITFRLNELPTIGINGMLISFDKLKHK